MEGTHNNNNNNNNNNVYSYREYAKENERDVKCRK